jgi:hypothetical protein
MFKRVATWFGMTYPLFWALRHMSTGKVWADKWEDPIFIGILVAGLITSGWIAFREAIRNDAEKPFEPATTERRGPFQRPNEPYNEPDKDPIDGGPYPPPQESFENDENGPIELTRRERHYREAQAAIQEMRQGILDMEHRAALEKQEASYPTILERVLRDESNTCTEKSPIQEPDSQHS